MFFIGLVLSCGSLNHTSLFEADRLISPLNSENIYQCWHFISPTTHYKKKNLTHAYMAPHTRGINLAQGVSSGVPDISHSTIWKPVKTATKMMKKGNSTELRKPSWQVTEIMLPEVEPLMSRRKQTSSRRPPVTLSVILWIFKWKYSKRPFFSSQDQEHCAVEKLLVKMAWF